MMNTKTFTKFAAALAFFGLVGSPLVFAPIASAALLTEKYEVVMKDYKFNIYKEGAPVDKFEFTGGLPTQMLVRNEDAVAHEIRSTLFKKVPVSMAGNAILISSENTKGFRVNPGQTVRLEFVPPENPDGDMEFDVFFCGIHGNFPNAKMRAEVITVPTITGTGAF